MVKKIGRPTTNPKENCTIVRLANDELGRIKFCMQQTGMTKTGIIGQGYSLSMSK